MPVAAKRHPIELDSLISQVLAPNRGERINRQFMRVGSLQIESLSCQRVDELSRVRPAAKRDLFKGIPCALVHRIQKRLIGGWNDLADPVMRQAFVIISNKVRIFLIVAIGHLRRCWKFWFLFRRISAGFVTNLSISFFSNTKSPPLR